MRLLFLVALTATAWASPELKPAPTAALSDDQRDLLRTLASRNLYHETWHNPPPNWLATELSLNTCLEAGNYLDDDIKVGSTCPSGVPLSTVDKTDDDMLTLKRPDGSTYAPCTLIVGSGWSCSMTVDAGDTLSLEVDTIYEHTSGTVVRAFIAESGTIVGAPEEATCANGIVVADGSSGTTATWTAPARPSTNGGRIRLAVASSNDECANTRRAVLTVEVIDPFPPPSPPDLCVGGRRRRRPLCQRRRVRGNNFVVLAFGAR